MSDDDNHIFGNVAQIQDCFMFSITKLTDFLPDKLDPNEADMTD